MAVNIAPDAPELPPAANGVALPATAEPAVQSASDGQRVRSAPQAPAYAFATTRLRWLEQLGRLRDGILMLVAAQYVIGYAVWSIHAADQHWGLLPALDAQYFVAGLFPALALVVGALVIAQTGNVLNSLHLMYKRVVATYGRRFRFLLFVWEVGLLAFAYSWLSRQLAGTVPLPAFPGPITSALDIYAFITLVVVTLLSYIFGANITEGKSNSVRTGVLKLFDIADRVVYVFEHPLRTLMVRLVLLAALVLGMVYYWSSVYPSLPQELGGVRPRCAFLSVTKDALPAAMLDMLVPADAALSINGNSVASSRLDVLFVGRESMLVRPRTSPGVQGPRVLEIKHALVQAINWCDV